MSIKKIRKLINISYKGQYTYDVHEKCLLFKTHHPPPPLVHLRPKFFHPLDLGRPISNTPTTHPPRPTHTHTHTHTQTSPSPNDNQ